MIAIDSSSCNIRDTAYLTIHVRDDPANLNYTIAKQPPCESLQYEFTNTSTFPPGKPFNPASFTWDFGDGTIITPGAQTVRHSYSSAGTYITKLLYTIRPIVIRPIQSEKELRVSPLVDARFETPATGCVPHYAVFNNTSLAGQEFYWDFGDGTLSNEVNPTHTYLNIGTYTVKLKVIDTTTCNKVDSTSMDITVYPKPVADFSFAPVTPEVNKPNHLYSIYRAVR